MLWNVSSTAPPPGITVQTLQHKIASLLSWMFRLHFCTVEGSGDMPSIFIYANGAHQARVIFCQQCFVLFSSIFSLQVLFTVHTSHHIHLSSQTLIESIMLSMKISRLISVMANAMSSTTSSTSFTVSLSVREQS